jgi:nucleotide-binding universal stress UspA family protein
MSIKTILVPLGDAKTGKAPLKAALKVAHMFDAHLEALHVRTDPDRALIDYSGDGVSGQLMEPMRRVIEERAKEHAVGVRMLFDDECAVSGVAIVEVGPGTGGVSASWREETGDENRWIERRGRLADVTVMGRLGNGHDAPTTEALETAILGTGRPMLLAPSEETDAIGKRVAIAWSGSAEAARATSFAMPFLKEAEAVSVLSVTEESNWAYSPEDLAAYLAWHGIDAKVRSITPNGGSTGVLLLSEAVAQGADLLVMGAYTHSRLREMILGGVTKHVLSATGPAVLMAH